MHLLDTPGVVDGNDVEEGVLPAFPASQEVAANPSEAIDGNLELLLCKNLHLHCGLQEERDMSQQTEPEIV